VIPGIVFLARDRHGQIRLSIRFLDLGGRGCVQFSAVEKERFRVPKRRHCSL
jgi:hypothetical protein